MAFIRWKPNKSGLPRAQLVHSYRDGSGKPRQRILAHLGEKADLTPEQISALESQYPDLKVNWQALPTLAPKPVAVSGAESLSDEELWRRMGELRRQRGWTIRATVIKLTEAGLPPIGGGNMFGLRLRAIPLRWTSLRNLERSAEAGQPQPPGAQELLPYLRKVFSPPAP